MKIFRKVGIAWFLFLVIYCSILMTLILFIGQLGVSLLFYYSDGEFLFTWRNSLHTALSKGFVIGLLLGVGLWIKNKSQERKNKK
ncbi:hypothetical protein AC790_01030 [Pantoea sp. RIT-PI-b]|nr:hypothetical protein AC790_01030 [Pantoea sp. RIT-PI-b]